MGHQLRDSLQSNNGKMQLHKADQTHCLQQVRVHSSLALTMKADLVQAGADYGAQWLPICLVADSAILVSKGALCRVAAV